MAAAPMHIKVATLDDLIDVSRLQMLQVKTAAAAAPMHLKAAASGNRIGEPEGVG